MANDDAGRHLDQTRQHRDLARQSGDTDAAELYQHELDRLEGKRLLTAQVQAAINRRAQ